MKKSPFSTPSGSKGKQSYNWKSNNHKNRTDYGYVKSDSYQCISPNGNQLQSRNDFIPLNISTPVQEQRRLSGNWYGSGGCRNHRNSGSGGLNQYKNNYHVSPKSNFNNSYSPYEHYGKQFHGQKKGYQRDARKRTDISRYIDMKSFLEDPWAELLKKFNKSKEACDAKSPKVEPLLLSQSVYRNSKSDSESQSITDIDESCVSLESRNESSVNVTSGLDDSDISDMSRTESSIDLKIDNVSLGQDLKNKGICSSNDNTCEDIHKGNNIHNLLGSETSTIQGLI